MKPFEGTDGMRRDRRRSRERLRTLGSHFCATNGECGRRGREGGELADEGAGEERPLTVRGDEEERRCYERSLSLRSDECRAEGGALPFLFLNFSKVAFLASFSLSTQQGQGK
jgi:hypothetical protein